MPMIEFKNVSKWYGSFQVLADCSTELKKGEVVVVCGPSGSGKSTLIKCVNALEPFQKGEVLVDGISVGVVSKNIGAASRWTSLSMFSSVTLRRAGSGSPPCRRLKLAASSHRRVSRETVCRRRDRRSRFRLS